MLTLCESDHLSNELYAVEFLNGKFNSMLTNGSSTDGQQHCLDATGTRPPEMRNVTFDDGADVQCTPSIAAYFCIIHDNQTRKMKNVVHLFRAIGPILIKLESLVLDTSTGELDNMHLYYDFWQHQLFELLIRYFELLTWDFGHFCETLFVLPISFNETLWSNGNHVEYYFSILYCLYSVFLLLVSFPFWLCGCWCTAPFGLCCRPMRLPPQSIDYTCTIYDVVAVAIVATACACPVRGMSVQQPGTNLNW